MKNETDSSTFSFILSCVLDILVFEFINGMKNCLKFYFNITAHSNFIFPGINLSITIFLEIFTKNNISKLQGLYGYRPVQVSA